MNGERASVSGLAAQLSRGGWTAAAAPCTEVADAGPCPPRAVDPTDAAEPSLAAHRADAPLPLLCHPETGLVLSLGQVDEQALPPCCPWRELQTTLRSLDRLPPAGTVPGGIATSRRAERLPNVRDERVEPLRDEIRAKLSTRD